MGFLSEFIQTIAATAQHTQRGQAPASTTLGGGPKKPDCTPCAAGAYVDSLRDFATGKSARKKKAPRRRK